MRLFYPFLILLFVSANTCLAQSGWFTQNSGINSWLQTVSFPDANNGMAVGVFGQILKTTNGGTTWTGIPGGAGQYLTGISMPDPNTATVVGATGLILRTTNGGSTWTTQTSGTSVFLWQVKFTSADTGTVVGNNGTILRTTNGGTTWTAQTSGTTSDLYYLDFTDANHGTVVGVNGTILRTTNGGTTWTSQTSGTTQNLLGVSFSDASNGTITGGGGTILRTTNGGTTWTAQTSGTTNKLMGVSFPDANTGTVVGELGTILRTTNGGATWTTQTSGTTRDLVGVDFINPTTGTIVGDFGVILRTTTGGVACTSAPAQPAAITGPASACAGRSFTYTVPAVPGANSYTWTLPSGWTGTSTSNSIFVTTTNTGGNISVTAVNHCGSSPVQTLAVTVDPAPPATITPAGITTFCQGGSVVLNANTGAGFTYQWRLNGVAITGATNPSYTANASGSYTVVITNNNCFATSAAAPVTVQPLPAPVITQSGNTLTAPAGFTSYQWYRDNMLIPGATNLSYTATQSGSFHAVVTNGNNCTGQSNTLTITGLGVADHSPQTNIVVYPNPAQGLVKLKGNAATASHRIFVTVVDLTGRNIITKEARITQSSFETDLDLSAAPAGVYFIKLFSESINLVKPIVLKGN